MGRTVGEQRTRDEVTLIDGRVADLTGSIRATTKSFEGTIDVVQGRFDGAHALVGEVGHGTKLSGRR